jgi:hypothetical protein
MNTHYTEEVYFASPGVHLVTFLDGVSTEARKLDKMLIACFNDTFVRVYPESTMSELQDQWFKNRG